MTHNNTRLRLPRTARSLCFKATCCHGEIWACGKEAAERLGPKNRIRDNLHFQFHMPSALFGGAYSVSGVVVGAIRPLSAPIASSWSMTNSRSTLGHGRQTGQLTLKLPTLSDLVVVPRDVVWGDG